MYELVYPDGQETLEVTLSEARKTASGFIGHNVEHEKKTYKVRTALFDPTRGVVVTTTTGETFVHVMLRKPGRVLPPPRVGAKKKTTKFRKRGRPRKQASAPKPLADIGIPEEKVRKGIAGMFKAGMTISEIAGIFEVPPVFIENLLRKMF